jgi:hypothetical protein
MPRSLVIAKLIALITLGLHVSGYNEGVGAYYHEVSLRDVCRRRVARNWDYGANLDCGHPCLAAAITDEPTALGTLVLADLPGGSMHM